MAPKTKFCCNPFNWKKHSKVKTQLRYISSNTIASFVSIGVQNLSTTLLTCAKCRKELAVTVKNLSKIDKINPDNIIDLSIDAKTTESINTASTLMSKSSSNTSFKRDFKMEKIKSLANLLNIEVPNESALNVNNQNYRKSTTESFYALIQKEIHDLFQGDIKKDSDDFSQVTKSLFKNIIQYKLYNMQQSVFF